MTSRWPARSASWRVSTRTGRLSLVESLLGGLGIDPDVRRDGSLPQTPVTIHVGGATVTPSTAAALDALGVAGPDGLDAQGYVFASGEERPGHAHIVLAGVDATGTFYAAQTLGQVIEAGHGRPKVPGLTVRDWPGFGFRGGMESFYGPEWSQADRLAQVDFLATHKMDTFFYGPAGDPRTGTLWDSVYDAEELGRMQEVLERARDQHVKFIYRVSPEAPIQPSRGMCHSSVADRQKLVARFEQLWGIGVRQFVVAWDDVAGHFTCAQDTETYGDDAVPIAAAQTEVVNYLQTEFIDKHPDARPLITVPTEYWGNDSTPYRTRFDNLLTPSAQIYWTGPSVVSDSISVADIIATQQAFPKHDLVVWDNYPVNDFAPNRLFMGPVVNRAAQLGEHSLGITFNEMQLQAPSQLVLFTEADYAWNPGAYDPDDSWDRGLRELGGDVHGALRTFAENNYSLGNLHPQESLSLSPLLTRFRDAYTSFADLGRPAMRTSAEFGRMTAARSTLRAGLDDPPFLAQAAPWLDKLALSGTAGQRGVSTLTAQVRGDLREAWRNRLAMEKARAELAKVAQVVADGVVDPFLDLVKRESDGWLGAGWYGGVADVNGAPAAASGSSLAAAADGNVASAYRAAAKPAAADALTVMLDSARPLDHVLVLQDIDTVAPSTVLGRTPAGDWVELGRVSQAAAEVPAGKQVVDAIRLVWATGAPAPTVHEIIPAYSDAMTAHLSTNRSRMLAAPGSSQDVDVTLRGVAAGDLTAAVSASGPQGWTVAPEDQQISVRSEGRTVSATRKVTVAIPEDAANGSYPVRITATQADGRQAAPVDVTVQVARTSSKAYRDLIADDQPTGYWRLAEAAGSPAADSAGHGLSGEYLPSLEHGVDGALTRASDIDDAVRLTGGYVNVPNSSELQITGPFTLEAWIKPDGAARDPGLGIIERYDQPAFNGYILRIVGGNRVQAWVLGSSGSSNVTGSTAVPVGSWHHVAAVYDGTRLTVYVDGQPDGSAVSAVAPGAGSGDLRLGARGDDANQRFAGGLDEVAVYRTALTPEQIATHYLTGVTG